MAKNTWEGPCLLQIYPPFYKRFRCMASACPDSCCVGWEVVVDDDAAAFYRRLPGPLGSALREAMTIDADGDRIFTMADGHCPFWTHEHLCRLELELGPEAPCATCRKFPRLTQDYGVFTEYGLTLACPGTLETQGEPGDPQAAECDWAFLLELVSARSTLLELLWRQDLSSREGLALCLATGSRFQALLDGQAPEPWQEAEFLSRFRAESPGDFRPLLQLHRGLEILTPAWQALLEEALATLPLRRAGDAGFWAGTAESGDILPLPVLAAGGFGLGLCVKIAKIGSRLGRNPIFAGRPPLQNRHAVPGIPDPAPSALFQRGRARRGE